MKAVSQRDSGIAVRHRTKCRSLDGGSCNCGPAYQVNVWSRRDGRRLWKTCATLAEARSWQVDVKQALRKGTLRAPTPVTLREEAEAWLDGARAGVIRTRGGRRFKPSVLRSYERALKLRVLPELGGAKLGSITHIDLQHFVDRLRGTTVDPKRPELGTLDPSCEAAASGLERYRISADRTSVTNRGARQHAANGLTERRRSRTDRAWGYHTAQVLKTCWATGPMPLRD